MITDDQSHTICSGSRSASMISTIFSSNAMVNNSNHGITSPNVISFSATSLNMKLVKKSNLTCAIGRTLDLKLTNTETQSVMGCPSDILATKK